MKWFLLILITCSHAVFAVTGPNYVDYVALAESGSKKFVEEVCRRFDVVPMSSGGGAMDVVRHESYSFNIYHSITRDEARRIIVESTDLFLECINENREARPYYITFPMTESNIDLGFSVKNPKTYDDLSTSIVSSFGIYTNKLNKPVILYNLNNKGKTSSGDEYLETFEEARKIVYEERQRDPSLQQRLYRSEYINNPQSAQKTSKACQGFLDRLSNLINFTNYIDARKEKYTGPPYERKVSWELDDHCQQLSKEYGLRFFRYGCFTGRPCATLPHGFSFLGSQQIELSEARLIGITFVDSLLHKLNSSTELHNWRIREWQEKKFWASDPSKDIPLKEVCMKIVYWDKNIDRIMPPHIAQILFLDEKLQYFQANPKTQELELVFEESLENARKYKEELFLKYGQ